MTPRPRSRPAAGPLNHRRHLPTLTGPVSSKSFLEDSAQQTLWIFGYGSLCWKPDFEYMNKMVGHVRGYSRKFWQGNTAHRGTPGKPGRVATLVEDKDNEVWGVGYEVLKDSPVLDYLWERECLLGGYHLIQITFHPIGREAVQGLAYLATPSSPGWLGDASESEIALQVAEAKGPAGPNSEYICRLATWIRNNAPVRDPHLDLLDLLVRTAESYNVLNDRFLIEERLTTIIKNLQVSQGQFKQFEYSFSRTQA